MQVVRGSQSLPLLLALPLYATLVYHGKELPMLGKTLALTLDTIFIIQAVCQNQCFISTCTS